MSKIYTMDATTLDEDTRESREAQLKKNAERVARARKGLGKEMTISDLLANLMHLCDTDGEDFDVELTQARDNYQAEAGDAPYEWFV
ncbi:MAG: hypothetical protein ACREMY_02505 [bacterium]